MHNNIYQLSKKPLDADDFIHDYQFEDSDIPFADGIEDWDEDELDKAYATFPLMGIFERHEDCLTYLGEGDIRKRWVEYASEDKIDEQNIANSTLRFRYTQRIEQPFTLDRFCIEDDAPITSGDFLSYVLRNLKKGDKLYLGEVVNFHW